MKNINRIFINSVQLPKKRAAFNLNRIGMDYVMMYLALLFIVFSLSNFTNQFQENAAATTLHVKPFFLLIFFFIFNYLIIFIVGLIYISALAYLGRFVSELSKRKVRYNILWKMTACLMTLPMLLYGLASFFITIPDISILLMFVFHFIFLSKIILIYPPRKHRSNKI